VPSLTAGVVRFRIQSAAAEDLFTQVEARWSGARRRAGPHRRQRRVFSQLRVQGDAALAPDLEVQMGP